MDSALLVHRIHFAFTITFHYIFPQLTMGLALLLVYLKTQALRTNDEHYNRAARFWARILGISRVTLRGKLNSLGISVERSASVEEETGTEARRPVGQFLTR